MEHLSSLLINKATKKRLQNYLKKPSHGLIITGTGGSGKEAIARALAAELLEVKDLSKYPYYIEVNKPKDKQEISIDEVRKIIRALELKIPLNKPVNRVILINEANLLSGEGQNSLLKVLEEPAPKTIFFLTSPSIKNVLPTIASRVQELSISAVSLDEALQHFGNDYPKTEVTKAWQLSGGTVGLLSALLDSQDDHPLKVAIELGKKLIKQSRYERLIELDKLSANKPGLSLTIEALGRILSYLHHEALEKDSQTKAQKLLGARQTVNEALNSLSGNTSAKLVALNLALNLDI